MTWLQTAHYSEEDLADYPRPYDDAEAQAAEDHEPIGIVAWLVVPVLLVTSIYAHQEGTGWIPQLFALALALVWLTIDVLGKRKGVVLPAPYLVFFCWMLWETVGNVRAGVEVGVFVNGFLSTLKVFALSLAIANIVQNYRNLIPVYLATA